ncbi:hypothetical protein DY000_02009270 [Brassica cretica]|uniref:Secreted protein n=1 Tax=Brassica cretica TaxID=69181 RepID=A0ABQ7CAT2_BRACR|nr:hypothetical protein DY000_02009270 [Brassica cretica]
MSAFTASELGLLFSQLFLFVPIEDFLLFRHRFVERGAFPSRSAFGPSWMPIDVLIGIVGDIARIQGDVLDFVILRIFRGRRRTFRVSLFDGRFFARVLARRLFPRGSSLSSGVAKLSLFPRTLVVPRGRISLVLAVKVSTCLVKVLTSLSCSSDLFSYVVNIFLNYSSATALAGVLAADTSAAGVWRSVPLLPLRRVCTLSALSADMSG